jgi:Phage endonuclease I
LEKSGVDFKYEGYKIPYMIVGHYTPDFTIKTIYGKLIVETKGHFRTEDKRKMVAVKKLNPHLDIRFVFYSSVKSNARWCRKHGFQFAIGNIPREWIQGL